MKLVFKKDKESQISVFQVVDGHEKEFSARRSSIQVVELQEQDGKLSCNRDEPTLIDMQPMERR